MAQALSDIYNSLNAAYNPQRDVYNQQLGQVDQQSQGAIQGAHYQKDAAFQGITNQANANGMFYSGAPVKEEQMYTGGTYAPAIANIQNAAQNQKFSLQGALAGVGVNQTNQANQLYGTQMGQDQQQRQYEQSYQQQALQNQSMRDIYSRPQQAAAPATPQWQQNFNTGLGNAFKGFGSGMAPGQTEKTIIPQMVQQYGAYADPAAIAKQVYAYRKAVYNQ